MKKNILELALIFYSIFLLAIISCNNENRSVTKEATDSLGLKRGTVIACGPPGKQFGTAEFETSCTGKTKKDFDLAIALLHSFEYDEAEKMFAKVIDEEPGCAMAYWGVAMANYHPLWAPPTHDELEKGVKAVAIAQSLNESSKREKAYIDAMAAFYKEHDKIDHRTRNIRFEKAMEKLYAEYPADKEAAIFYALSLTAAADPADTSFQNQKKAGTILTSLYPGQPEHPGIVHYIIHSYDYPGLAKLALSAARKYAAIAPSSAHAQHMPSHIFTRLGLWDENIKSNLVAGEAARCYAKSAGLPGHWDEELHTLDYLVYSYLQKGDNKLAKQQVDYVKTITDVQPVNFKVAYAFASIPARYALENKNWEEAASLQLYPADLAWQNFPWQKAIFHFARLMGAVQTNDLEEAGNELKNLNILHDQLTAQKDNYKANQVEIQLKASTAWIRFKEGKKEEALKLMNEAAEMEDKTEKHPVTPGEIIPARELLGDMLLQVNMPAKALEAYEADLKKHVNRFNGLYGAGLAAERSKDIKKATYYYQQLLSVSNSNAASRPELALAKAFLNAKNL